MMRGIDTINAIAILYFLKYTFGFHREFEKLAKKIVKISRVLKKF